MKTYVNAGHWDDKLTNIVDDPGATHLHYIESKLNILVRDVVKHYMKDAGFSVEYVPDDIDLFHSIEWVNDRANKDDIAISFHFNAHRNRDVRGVEVFYSTEKELAGKFAQYISEELKIPNNGAKHDSQSYVKRLSWLRRLKCPSILIEVCFLTNSDDMRALDFDAVARGVMRGMNLIRITNPKMEMLAKQSSFIRNYLNKIRKKYRL